MNTTKTEQLAKAFDFKDVEWRVGNAYEKNGKWSGTALPYVTNRAIQDKLDEVFGIEGWYNDFKRWGDNAQLCGLTCKFGEQWITKWDGSTDSAMENIDATKAGLSSSMKRSAVQFSIGRYLYKLDTVYVDLDVKGKGKYIKKEEYAKLENFYNQQIAKIFGNKVLPLVQYNKPTVSIAAEVQKGNNNTTGQFVNKQTPTNNTNTKNDFVNSNVGKVDVVRNSIIKSVRQVSSIKKINVDSILEFYKVASLDDFSVEQAKDCLQRLGSQTA